ncbi:hypothetical protein MTR_8g019070 [Medicago truncatula]|uniref:Uncharacterized protein n=1 Tax=Medicago truncatula TaxID=3880 RepID=G7ZXG6_MEDTR|nr:hypothetical protein MTR_8g019070 [Medicago truncatula]
MTKGHRTIQAKEYCSSFMKKLPQKKFDHRKLVVKEIAHIIRYQLEEGKPSWKQLSGKHQDDFFDSFMKTFTWQPKHKVKKKEKGADPPLTGFYFRTRRKKDQSWMDVHVESAYVEVFRSQVHALNASLQRQEQEKLHTIRGNKCNGKKKEMINTNKKLDVLMKHLGFVGSSSHVSNPNSELNEHIDEVVDEDDNDFVEDNISYHIYN